MRYNFEPKQLEGIIDTRSEETLRLMLKKIIYTQNIPGYLRVKIANIINGTDQEDPEKRYCAISETRSIRWSYMFDLSVSPMLNYLPEILTVATRPGGAGSTKEIILNVLSELDDKGKERMSVESAMNLKHRTHVGYILEMAGLVQKNTQDKDSGFPRRKWHLNRHDDLTKFERAQMIKSKIQFELQRQQTLEGIL